MELTRLTTPADRARQARACLTAARARLDQFGYQQIRVDQYEHPGTKVLVETGYVYGETRLVVRNHPQADNFEGEDFRIVGTADLLEADSKFKAFERLIAA